MKNAIRIWFRSMTDVRGGERVPVGLMLGYGFLALASYYIVKSVRSAVFIERVGSDMLSYVYMLTAVFVAVLMVVYSRYADRIRERALLLGTFVLLGTSLVFLWWMLRDDAGGWVAWTLYIFSKLYPLLLVSQFWLVANLLFTTRQAKRLFGIIGLALILGGIAGAEVASRLADVVGTRTLLLLAVTPLPFCALIVLGLGSRLEQGRTASARLLREFSGDAVKLLVRSPHLRNISAVLALTILVGTLLDWQLGRAVDLYVSSEDAMAGFYGSFYRTLNIVSVGVQLFFTSFVLRRFGVGVALLALPLALFGASIAVIAVPALITASFAKGAEGALRYSLDQSTREMLFLPVPNETLYKVKPLIDLAVYRGATGVGGLLLILATNILGFGLRGVGVICLVLIVAWVVVAVRMRHRYGDALAQSFERRVASAGTVFASVMNAESRPFVRQALADGNTLHAAFALDLLDQSGPEDLRGLTDAVHGVLSHEEPRIREHALKVLGSAEGADLELVRECLADPDAGVRVAAATALLSLAGPRRDSVMGELLGSPDAPVRVAALEALAATRNGNVPEVVVDRFFEELARSESTLTTAERRELAMAAGLVGGRSLARDVAHGLARDPDRAVASAALRSLGLIGDAGSTRLLIEGLGRSGTRAVAREALVTSSADVVPALVDMLNDPTADPLVRRSIPFVMADIPTQASADALVRSYRLPETDQWLDDRSLRALERLRSRSDLAVNPVEVKQALHREIAAASRYGAALDALAAIAPDGRSVALLLRLLEEARAARLDSVFRWLGLCFPQEEVRRSRLSLLRGDSRARANALEWIEHMVGHKAFAYLTPAFDRKTASLEADEAHGDGMPRPEPTWNPVRDLWDDEDHWVARCAAWTMVDLGAATTAECGSTPWNREGLGFGAEPDLVERALWLTDVDVLRDLPAAHLALLGSIAEEVDIEAGHRLLQADMPGDAIHVILEGEVEGGRPGSDRLVFGAGSSVGAWALIDDGPALVDARTKTPMRALRIRRTEFRDVVEDYPELAAHLLGGLGRRLRALISASTTAPAPGAAAAVPPA